MGEICQCLVGSDSNSLLSVHAIAVLVLLPYFASCLITKQANEKIQLFLTKEPEIAVDLVSKSIEKIRYNKQNRKRHGYYGNDKTRTRLQYLIQVFSSEIARSG
jgi:hypothetical protein